MLLCIIGYNIDPFYIFFCNETCLDFHHIFMFDLSFHSHHLLFWCKSYHHMHLKMIKSLLPKWYKEFTTFANHVWKRKNKSSFPQMFIFTYKEPPIKITKSPWKTLIFLSPPTSYFNLKPCYSQTQFFLLEIGSNSIS
jgi:hypothetical protein